jgi:hypothetical protein
MATPRLVARGFDSAAALPAFQLYGPENGPEISGMIRPPGPLSPTHPLFRHEEVAMPHFYRSAGFNEVFRPNRQHHLLNLGWLENGRVDFRCTIWRSEQTKLFTNDDARFAAAIARHIRHGMAVADAIEAPEAAARDFVALGSHAPGLVYLNTSGPVRAMDSRAEEIFRQLGAFDADVPESLKPSGRERAFEAVSQRLREIFPARADPNPNTTTPCDVIYSNRRGLGAKLSGFVLSDASGSAGFGVIVELGESCELLRSRVKFRYGLSSRQAEILELITRTGSGSEYTRVLGISPGTLRSHLRDLMNRLE